MMYNKDNSGWTGTKDNSFITRMSIDDEDKTGLSVKNRQSELSVLVMASMKQI
jgi:hypothetical protein